MKLPERIETFIAGRMLSPKTEKLYRAIFKRIIEKIGKTDFEQEDVVKFIVDMKAKMSDRSLAIYATVLKSYLKFYDKPTHKIKIPRAPQKFKVPLNAEEVKRFFKQEMPLNMLVAFRLMCFSGLRISEVLGIKEKDVDWEERTIKIHGKGMKERKVIMDKKTASLLKTLFEKDDEPFKDLYERYLQLKVKKYAKLAGIEIWKEVTPHTLRHTFASLWEKNAGPRGDVEYLLGHRPKTTDIYTTDIRGMKETYDKVIGEFAEGV